MPMLENFRYKANLIIAEKELVGRAVPAFKFMTLDGVSLTNADLNGSVYILDFWTSPESFPPLNAFYLKYKEDGLKVFAVAPGRYREEIKQFLKTKGLSVGVFAAELDGIAAGAFYASYGHPITVLVNRDGTVVKLFLKPSYKGEFEDIVKNALAETK